MDTFIKEGNGITKVINTEIRKHFDYAELLEINKNLKEKLAENEELITECKRLGVELPNEEIAEEITNVF
jgi:hypothetical protein